MRVRIHLGPEVAPQTESEYTHASNFILKIVLKIVVIIWESIYEDDGINEFLSKLHSQVNIFINQLAF